MEDLNISMNVGPGIARAIYYAQGQGSVFTNPGTRVSMQVTAGAAVLSLVCYYLAARTDYFAWIVLMVLSALFTIACVFDMVARIKKYLEWKKGADDYIKSLSKYSAQQLRLTNGSIELEYAGEIRISRWEQVHHVSVFSSYVMVQGGAGYNYLLPAGAMQPAEFEMLVLFVREKMRLGSGNEPAGIQAAG